MYDMIIIGSGPAGLTAAIYGQRAKLSVLLLEKQPLGGGQVMNTCEVDNYPGFPGISGFELSEKFTAHAKKMGAEICAAEVRSVDFSGEIKRVTTDKGIFEGRTVVIATGAVHRKLAVKGEEKLAGMGVSYCATCDGAFFRGKDVAVVGGGDVALEDALFLARASRRVYLIHRRDAFRGAQILQQRVMETENIEVIRDSVVEEIAGEQAVESLTLYNKKKEEKSVLAVQGIFIAVGNAPDTELFREAVALDETGYVKAQEDCVTSCPGVFAAGDVRTKPLRQIITAASDGANAVTSVERYLVK